MRWQSNKASFFTLVIGILLSSLILRWSDATAPNNDLARPRRAFFCLRWQEVKETLKNNTREKFALVYVSTFRNVTALYFNLILEKQPPAPHATFYQDVHVDDDDLVKLKSNAPSFGFCLTLLHSYHLRDEHFVRHIVVFTEKKGQNCSDVKFICDQSSLLSVYQNIVHMSEAGYVHTGISSFQNYQGLHYTTKFVKSPQEVTWLHEMTGGLVYNVRKDRGKNAMPFFLGATYNGAPRESPEVYSLLFFKSSVSIRKGDFSVVQYRMNSNSFHLDEVQRRLKAAYNRENTPLLPVSAIVQYRRNSKTGHIHNRLIILLVSPKLLQQASELL